MSTVLVDSNVLLDVMTGDPRWSDWSTVALRDAAETGRLVINAIIYGEVSVRFSRIEDLEAALPRAMLEREHIPYEAAFLAGKVFQTNRKQGGEKRSPLPDFLIGAHAAVAGYDLLTRDARQYRTYFSGLNVIAPA
jgi:predicted nucleic acid-binding protein